MKTIDIDEKEDVASGKPKSKKKRKIPYTGLWVRIGILLSLLVLGFSFIKSRQTKQSPTNILGAQQEKSTQTSVQDIVDETSKSVRASSTQAANNVLGVATQTLDTTTKAVTTTVSNTVVNNIISIISGQLDKLPKDQQTEIKKAICN